jgi:hypothetical protein
MVDVPRLSTAKLNSLFLKGLGDCVVYSQRTSEKPMLVDIMAPYKIKLRVYLYNCTNPPGGRSVDEYKSQIIVPGQKRGMKGNFDFSDDRIVILGAYACLDEKAGTGVFVLWDAMFHVNFSYSANIQIKSENIVAALATEVYHGKRNNNEVVITCRGQYLKQALIDRIRTVSLPRKA